MICADGSASPKSPTACNILADANRSSKGDISVNQCGRNCSLAEPPKPISCRRIDLAKRKRRLTLRLQFTLQRLRFVDEVASDSGPLPKKIAFLFHVSVSGNPPNQPERAARSIILLIVASKNDRRTCVMRRRTGDGPTMFQHCTETGGIGMGFAMLRRCFIAGQAEAGTRCVPRPGLFFWKVPRSLFNFHSVKLQ